MIAPKTLMARMALQSGIVTLCSSLRRHLTKSQVAILMYHRVCPHWDRWSLRPMSPLIFERQIEYLATNFTIVSLEDLARHVTDGTALPRKAVAITFDDGYKDNYLHAFPVLNRYNVPATVFLSTGCIGTGRIHWWDLARYTVHHTTKHQVDLGEIGVYRLETDEERMRAKGEIVRRMKAIPEGWKTGLIEELIGQTDVDIPENLCDGLMLTWEDVGRMIEGGISIGAHTVHHPILTNVPLPRAASEILTSKKTIEDMTGREVTGFSYPNGNYNDEILEIVKKSGFSFAVSNLPRKLISRTDDPYALSRIDAIENIDTLKFFMSGIPADLEHILKNPIFA